MNQNGTPISIVGRILAAIISLVIMMIGIFIFMDEYAPGRSTRFGFRPPLYGTEAKKFGMIYVSLGLLPLMVFCKSPRQAATIGSVLGTLIIAIILYTIYA